MACKRETGRRHNGVVRGIREARHPRGHRSGQRRIGACRLSKSDRKTPAGCHDESGGGGTPARVRSWRAETRRQQMEDDLEQGTRELAAANDELKKSEWNLKLII